jgi:hypothetical protein
MFSNMNLKTFKIGLVAPIAAAGIFGFSGAASAAIFSGDSINQLNFNLNFDINNLQYQRVGNLPGLPPNPSGLIIKGVGLGVGVRTVDAPRIDFLPPVGNGTPSPINISGSVNVSGGLPGFEICNSGGGNSTTCTPATINDFVVDSSVGSIPLPPGGAIVSPFITVNGATPAALGLTYLFELDKNSLDTSIPGNSIIQFAGNNGTCVSNPGQAGCEAFIDFFAKGKLTITGIPNDPAFADQLGKTYAVTYSYAGPRLAVDAANSTSCGAAIGSMCSIEFLPTAGAGNLRVTVAVPEPGSVGGLMALGALGSFGILKRKKLSK